MITKALHILLALTVLISSSGLVLNQHFCRGERQKVALFVHAKGCRMAAASTPCSGEKMRCARHDREMRRNCCSDRSDYLKLVQDQQVSASQLPVLKQPVLFGIIPVDFLPTCSSIDISPLYFQTYKPPIVCADFQSRLQTYRL